MRKGNNKNSSSAKSKEEVKVKEKEQAKEKKDKKSNALVSSAKSQLSSLKQDSSINIFQSIGARLLLIIFASIVICVSTVGIVSYQKAKGLLETNVADASMQTIKQVGNSIDTVLKSYIDISFQIMFDSIIVKSMEVITSTDKTYELLEANRNINEKLSNYMVTNNTIKNIALIPLSKADPIINGSLTQNTLNMKTGDEYRSAAWFKAAEEESGATIWIEPQAEGILDTTPYESVALARLSRNLSNADLSFMIVIEFNADQLFNAAYTVDFGDGSEVAVMDNNLNYAFSQNKERYGSEPNVAIEETTTELTSSSRTVTGADGQSYLAVFQTLQNYDQWRILGTIPIERLAEQAAPISQITIIICIIAGIIAVGIGIFVMKNVGAPLSQLSRQMEKGAKGDLTVRASVKARKDEIGKLALSFDAMMEQISALATQTTHSAAEVLKTASQLSETSNKTAIAAKEIAVATDEIAGGATSLAVEAEKGTDLTNKINEQMEQVNEYADQMSSSAREVENASQQGLSYMSELIDKTASTEQMTRAMVDKVNSLQDSTKSIVKILDVLNSITQQTNILSLNATIEAARAGAAGKGFMVVADEIRQLADQSRHSIEVVGQITAQISNEIKETVNVLTEAYPLFQEQIGSVKEANQLFLSVQAQMEQFKNNMNVVTEAFEELNKSQEILSDSMNSVSAVAEQSSATSEEVASLSTEQLSISQNLVQLSEQLQQVSNNLKDSLTKFKI